MSFVSLISDHGGKSGTYEVGGQVGVTRASRDGVDGDRVRASDERARRDVERVDLTQTTVSATSNTARVDLRRCARSRRAIAVDLGLRPAAGERQGRADAESGRTSLRRGESELDRERSVDTLEEGHGNVRQGAGADGVGQRSPAAHAAVRWVHALDLVGVAEAKRLAVPITNRPDGRGEREGRRNVLGDSRARRDGDRVSRDLELILVEDLGVGARLHGRRGEGTVG